MSIEIPVKGTPPNIRRKKGLVTDIEDLKKNEINRRRRLRLEQVHLQSKDIASQTRRKVGSEQNKQGKAFERQQAAELKRMQAHRLLLLQCEYQNCLEGIGAGHMQAALQPDAAAVLQAQHKRNRMQAEDRGREAAAELRRAREAAEQKRNASREQHKLVQNIEHLRSVVVASLQKKTLKQTSSKGVAMSAERSHSDDLQPKVWVYDHGNRFDSELPVEARVERTFPNAQEPDASEAAQMFASSKLLLDDEAATSRLRSRGQQALIKERLHQDYRQLLGDLHTLAREERLIQSTRAHRLPREMFLHDYRYQDMCTRRRQNNMDSAFENLYQTTEKDIDSSVDCPHILNVAGWQVLKPSRDPTRETETSTAEDSVLLLADSTAPTVLQKNDEGGAGLDEESGQDTVRDEQVPVAAGRGSFNQNSVKEDEVGGLPCGRRRHHETSRGGVETQNVDESDATAVLTEYSLNLSVCKTREQNVESAIVRSSSSSSACYEGLKIVVSLSKLTDEKHQPAISPERVELFPPEGSLLKVKRSDNAKRKIREHGGCVEELATVVRGSEQEGCSNREPTGAGKGGEDRTSKWKDIMVRSFPVDKDLSEVSTCYMSPPHQVLASSGIQDVEELPEYQKSCLHACGIDPWLAIYISQLLAMSRRSVENLDVSSSDTSAPDVEFSMAEKPDREVITDSKKTKETTRTNLRCGPDAVEEEMEYGTVQYETVSHMRRAVRMESVSPVTGACVRHSVIEIHSNSASSKMNTPEGSESKDAYTCGSLCETPPFISFISDMSLDEYKVFKFPEIFADYSENCSERISNLTKKIEHIRGEKRKLVDCSGGSGSGFDLTKYLSPPESSTVMTHDKWHTHTAADSGQRREGAVCIEPGDRSGTAEHWLQSAVDTRQIKEAECAQSVCSCNTVAGDKSASGEDSAADDIPDVMLEMLRRGLITSPLPWTKMAQQSDREVCEVSALDGPAPLSHDAESRNLLASLPQVAEHEKFKQAVLESYVGKGTGTAKSFRDRESIADKKMGFSQQVAETFAKLGNNPSRTDVNNAFKNLGFKWKARGRDQPVSPVISREDLDPASEEFRQQVLESFVGLGLDSSPEDLEAAFRRLGLDCPGASLYRSDVSEPNQTCSTSVTSESAGITPNSSHTNDPSDSTLLSGSVSSDDLLA